MVGQGRPVRCRCRQVLLPQCPPACPVAQANAPSCDRLEDLASLVYLNESSVLHTLRQRYGASLQHTYAGPSLLVLSPRGAPAVYSEKVRCLLSNHVASWTHPPTAYPTFSGSVPFPGHPTGSCPLSQLTLGRGVISRGEDRKPFPSLYQRPETARVCISYMALASESPCYPGVKGPEGCGPGGEGCLSEAS